MKCKDCNYFKIDEDESNNDFKIGFCAVQGSETTDMKSDEMAVICSHDGGVFVGENFGCIKFSKKQNGTGHK